MCSGDLSRNIRMLALIEVRLRWHWESLAETGIILDYSNAEKTYEKERRKQESSPKGSRLGWKRSFSR